MTTGSTLDLSSPSDEDISMKVKEFIELAKKIIN